MYAIIRANKIKTKSDFNGALAHNFRLKQVMNADPNKANNYYGYSANSAREMFKELFENEDSKFKKRRKDAVLCIEYLITASPDFFKKNDEKTIDSYFADSVQFLNDRHGKANIMYAVRHNDETTPHLHVWAIPEHGGKLNCSYFMDGKKKLSELQSNFCKTVEKYGLKRGKNSELTKAKHTTVRDFYAEVNNTYQDFKKNESKYKLVEAGIFDGEAKRHNDEVLGRVDKMHRALLTLKRNEETLKEYREKARVRINELSKENKAIKQEIDIAYEYLKQELKHKMEINNNEYAKTNRSIGNRRNDIRRKREISNAQGREFGEVSKLDFKSSIKDVAVGIQAISEEFAIYESAEGIGTILTGLKHEDIELDGQLGEFYGRVEEFGRTNRRSRNPNERSDFGFEKQRNVVMSVAKPKR